MTKQEREAIRTRCEALGKIKEGMIVCNSRGEDWQGCSTGQADCPYGPLVMDCTDRLYNDTIEFITHALQDIPALLDALEEAEGERDGYQREAGHYKNANHILIANCTRLKSHAEALERAIKSIDDVDSVCSLCVYTNATVPCDVCEECGDDGQYDNWEFDQARFTEGGDGE